MLIAKSLITGGVDGSASLASGIELAVDDVVSRSKVNPLYASPFTRPFACSAMLY